MQNETYFTFPCSQLKNALAERLPSVETVFIAEQHIQSKIHQRVVICVCYLSALEVLCSAVCWDHPMVFAICFDCCLLVFWSSFVGFRAMLISGGMSCLIFPLKSVSSLSISSHSFFFRFFHSVFSPFVQHTRQSLWDAQVSNKLHRLKPPSIGLWRSRLHFSSRQEVMLVRCRIR